MWGNNQYQSSGPPSFPTPGGYGGGAPGFPTPNPYNHPGGPGGYAPPQGPPPGYPPPHGAPSYGQPPSGYHPPYGPPPGAPPGALRPGPPPGPPPPGAHQYGAPRPSGGPPPQHPQSRGFPGQSFRQQYRDFRSGYSADRAHPVPTQPQHYGPHFMNENNQDTQLSFQYSQCTGKKKALCIGINYFGQDGELRGCINDANNIKNFLIRHFGYREGDIVMLTDDAGDPRQHPTRDNIIRGMQWLVRNAAPDDSLFFHYSGHGGQTKDHDGDEADGYDEVIYPVDHRENGHIVDDHMHDIMVKSLPPGCRLTAIFDSCHSGSALDLPYIYSTEGKIKEPNLAAEVGQGLLGAVSSYARGDLGGVFRSAVGIVKSATGSSQKADKIAKATKTSPADVISWSGCKDSQTSADTEEAGRATGAMSFAFMSSLSANPDQSYQELLNSIRQILKEKYSQKPQLSSSHPMDVTIQFIC